MDQSAYVAGFFGVLIGITLTELIKGIAETLKNNTRIKYYLPHGILVTAIFVFIVQSFFDFQWLTKDIAQWTPLLLIRFTLPWVLLCLISYLLFPSFDGNQIIDFKDNFNKLTSGVFKFCVVLFPLVIFVNIFSLGYSIFHIDNLVMLVSLGFTLLAIFLNKDWVRVLLLGIGTCYLLYHAIYYPHV